MSVCLVRWVRRGSWGLVVDLRFFGGGLMLLPMHLLMMLHLLFDLALHVLVLLTFIALSPTVPAHIAAVLLCSLGPPAVAGQAGCLVLLRRGLRILIVEPGVLVSLRGGAVAHHHCPALRASSHDYLIIV